MKKKIFSITVISIAAIILFLFIRFLVMVHNSNDLRKRAEETLTEQTFHFNKEHRIKYNDLSERLKGYLSEEEFYNIKTWYDAYEAFKKIPEDNNLDLEKEANLLSFINYTVRSENGDKGGYSFYVIFIDTYWGMKLDYIRINE